MIEASLIAALQELISPYKYIFDWQDSVEQKSVYCRVTIISQSDVGHRETPLSLAPSENMVTQQSETALVRLQFFGDVKSTAFNDAKKMKALLGTHEGNSSFYRNGMAIQSVNGIMRVGIERDTKWYVSNAIDITVAYKSTIETTGITIDRVELESLLPPTNKEFEVEW